MYNEQQSSPGNGNEKKTLSTTQRIKRAIYIYFLAAPTTQPHSQAIGVEIEGTMRSKHQPMIQLKELEAETKK